MEMDLILFVFKHLQRICKEDSQYSQALYLPLHITTSTLILLKPSRRKSSVNAQRSRVHSVNGLTIGRPQHADAHQRITLVLPFSC